MTWEKKFLFALICGIQSAGHSVISIQCTRKPCLTRIITIDFNHSRDTNNTIKVPIDYLNFWCFSVVTQSIKCSLNKTIHNIAWISKASTDFFARSHINIYDQIKRRSWNACTPLKITKCLRWCDKEETSKWPPLPTIRSVRGRSIVRHIVMCVTHPRDIWNRFNYASLRVMDG